MQKQYNPEVEFKFNIDKNDVDEILESYFEKDTKLTPAQWEELYYKVFDHIFPAIYDSIRESINCVLEYTKLLERNQTAIMKRPCYLVKYRHPNAWVKDWEDRAHLLTQEDADAYIKYNHGHGEDEEWKVEKID